MLKFNTQSLIIKAKTILKREGVFSTLKKGILYFGTEIIPKKEVWFYMILDFENYDTFQLPENYTVERYDDIDHMPDMIKDQFNYYFKDQIHYKFLFTKYFLLPAELWIIKYKDNILGYHWTSINCFDYTTTIPVTMFDTVIFSAQTFPPFRGLGCWPHLIKFTISQLYSEGYKRIYIGSKVHNKPAISVIRKCNFREFMTARPIYTKFIKLTIWYKPSNSSM